jgi:hypothetical protein
MTRKKKTTSQMHIWNALEKEEDWLVKNMLI